MKQSAMISKPLDAKMQSGAEKEDDDEGESLLDFVTEHANEFFISHIPVESIQSMETTYMYFYGTVAHILAISLFFYFVWVNYTGQANQAFIVISKSDGSKCQNIPSITTGGYLADSSGNWIGSADFVDSQSIYSLALSNFQISTSSQYQDMMSTFRASLSDIGKISIHQDLSGNLLFWMSFIQYYSVEHPTSHDFSTLGYGNLQSLQLTGNPQNVFKLEYVHGSFVGSAGPCKLFSYSTFDQSNSLLTMNYFNYSTFVRDPVCYTALNPDSFGYVDYLDGDGLILSLDVSTFTTAMAVNYGILPIDQLKLVDKNPQPFSYKSVNYTIGQYFDVRYPLMNTVNCLRNVSEIPPDQQHFQTICFYVMGETFALPVFNHYGADYHEPTYCSCDHPVGTSKPCNEFNLLSGLVFFRSDYVRPILGDTKENLKEYGVFSLMTLLERYQTYRYFNKAAYNASFMGAANQWDPTAADIDSAMSFCQVPDGNVNISCSLMLFNSFDPTGFEVSNYKYQVFNGSCANSTSIDDGAWDKLLAGGPVSFVQSYYECYYSDREALVSAIGIASGNVQIFIPILVFMLLPFLYATLVAIRQVPPKPEYTKDEKDQALEIFSMLLLRLRDGKTRGIKPKGVLASLTKEIIVAAKEEGGYPDSDDEDDEESTAKHGSVRYSENGQPITRLRNSSINSAQSEEVSTVYDDQDPEYGRTSTNFGTTKSAAGQSPAQLKHRPRMAVFTKHIAERNRIAAEQQVQDTQAVRQFSTNSSTGPLQRTNTFGSFSPFARKTTITTIQNPNRINSTIARSPTAQAAVAPAAVAPSGALAYSSSNLRNKNAAAQSDRGSSVVPSQNNSTTDNPNAEVSKRGSVAPAGRRRSSLFGYIFGGDDAPANDGPRESEMISKRETYIDLNLQLAPDDVRVLNLPADNNTKQVSKKTITGNDVDLLVDDLLRLFGEATQHHSSTGVTPGAASLPVDSPLHAAGGVPPAASTEELDSVELDGSTTRDSFSLVQGKALSLKLAQVNFADLMGRDDKSIFVKLSNALCMHASIELKYEMRIIAQKYGDRVAYNIGGKMMTANHLDSVL